MPFTEHDALKAAVELANLSPCSKSKRGVVIFNRYRVLGRGYNHPPGPFICAGDDACRAACGRICIHAEQAALLDYEQGGDDTELLHVKVEGAQAVPSGPPSCWQCSRLILLVPDIQGVWLLHEAGLRRYSSIEFHRETLRTCGLPMVELGVTGDPVCTCADGRCVVHEGSTP